MTVLPQLERELVSAHARRGPARRLARAVLRRPLLHRRLLHRPRPALSLAAVLPIAAVAVVVAVVAVAVGAGSGRTSSSPPATGTAAGAGSIVLDAAAINPRTPLGPAIDDAVRLLRERLGTGVRVSRSGNQVVIRGASPTSRSRILTLTAPGRLAFFDWEADALTQNGRTVASQLRAQDPAALRISQGAGGMLGGGNTGSLSLYAAVALAARQPAVTSPRLSRPGPLYYLFGAPGSTACAVAAADRAEATARGQHCLLSGPASTAAGLIAGLPSGVSASQGRELIVPSGTLVLQAVASTPAAAFAAPGPRTGWFVLRDAPALTGAEITGPHAATDEAGQPDVTFTFTAAGERAFATVTARVAQRGNRVSTTGDTLAQHFAIAVDDRLISVPAIDFRQYPDGIIGTDRADIAGALTAVSARLLSTLLATGPLPVRLTPVTGWWSYP